MLDKARPWVRYEDLEREIFVVEDFEGLRSFKQEITLEAIRAVKETQDAERRAASKVRNLVIY